MQLLYVLANFELLLCASVEKISHVLGLVCSTMYSIVLKPLFFLFVLSFNSCVFGIRATALGTRCAT